MGSPNSILVGSDDPTPVRLLGEALPCSREFKHLGVGTRLRWERATGPVVEGCLAKVRSTLAGMPHLPSLERRSTVAGVMVLSTVMHGVALAITTERNLSCLQSRIVRAMWGTASPVQAKEVVSPLMSPGHSTSPHKRARYNQLALVARAARERGNAGRARLWWTSSGTAADSNGRRRRRPTSIGESRAGATPGALAKLSRPRPQI